MERHSMLKEIEATFSSIYNSVIVKSCKEENDDALQPVMVHSVLHELMLHCRRIEKMFKDGIIKRIDLSDMFREIVPLGKVVVCSFLQDIIIDAMQIVVATW